MATNYTLAEAVKIIGEGKDIEAIADIGKRFPLLTVKIATVSAKAGNDFLDLMSYMPEHMTANKLNSAIKNAVAGDEEETDVEEEATEEKPAKKEKKAKVKEETEDAEDEEADDADNDYESKTSNELYKILSKRGLTKGHKFSKKADMIAALRADDAGNNETEEDADTETEESTDESPYAGKKAMELFKECKSRGIKVKPKMKADFYIEKLVEDDEAKAVEDSDDDDDWGDDEEPMNKPEKTAKKETKKTAKKEENKKPDPEPVDEDSDDDDDDEDWDI